jgi:hypothetical protein
VSAVWARARADLRRRRGSAAALVVLIGLAAGVVLASVAGARRTGTSLDRLVAYTQVPDVSVAAPDAATATRIGQLPQVASTERGLFVFLSASPTEASNGEVVPFAAANAETFRTSTRLRVLRGHMPAVDEPFDVAVSPLILSRLHIGLGSRFRLYAYGLDQVEASQEAGFGQLPPPDGPSFTFRAVGVVRAPTDLNPDPPRNVIYEGNAGVYLTPAFVRSYAAALGIPIEEMPGMEFIGLHLRHGAADLRAFEAAARPLLGDHGQITAGNDVTAAVDGARRAVRFQAVALLAFAALAAVAALVILGQAVARQVALDAADHQALAALGMTRGQLAAVAMARAMIVAAGGAAMGLVVAVAVSARFPIGLARTVEIDPGLSVNVAVLLVGAVVTVALVAARAGLAAWRAGASTSGGARAATRARRSPVAESLARAGFPAPAVAGVRMSVEPGHGPTAVPVRTAMAATAAAVAGVTAAAVFALSLSHLLADPRRQGWGWDVVVGNPNAQGDPASVVVPRLVSNPLLGAVGGIGGLGSSGGGGLRIEGKDVPAGAFRSFKGGVSAVVLGGRLPVADDEIALGRSTLHALSRHIGDTVRVSAGGEPEPLRIVGTVLMPSAGDVLASKLGTGALLSAEGARRFIGDGPAFTLFPVRFAPGVDPRAAVASLERDFPSEVLHHVTAPEVENLRRVDALPLVLALLLVVLGVGALGHALVTAVRRRRKDLAVLKTLGFVRRQVAATVAWQATAIALVALVLGLPLGIALGRWVWTVVAAQVQAPADPAVPVGALALAVPVTVAVANLLAAGPGWMAGRLRPAAILRTE